MLIVNPNFTIDRTLELEVIVPGSVHRTGPAVASLGGKGVNVARVARAYGQPGVLVGFLPAFSAPELASLAAAEGATVDGIPVAGTVRSASVMLERSGRVSVFNEPGPCVEEVDWTRLLDEVRRRAPEHRTIVCAAASPPARPSTRTRGSSRSPDVRGCAASSTRPARSCARRWASVRMSSVPTSRRPSRS